MKKFRNVPAIITLSAGFVTCVLMIINKITIVTYLWTLALVMAGFYLVGLLVRFVLNKVFEEKKEEDKDTEDGETPEGEENPEGESASGENASDKTASDKTASDKTQEG